MKLFLPIKKGYPATPLTFYNKRENEKEKIIELLIPIDIEEKESYYADYYALLYLSGVTSETLIIEGNAPQSFFQEIKEEAVSLSGQRPAIHFTPNYGWINDPNGLVFQNGIYHMYFQYNPYDIKWNNMCWGHAISEDLLHWKQLDTVLYPDEHGTIFSGSGICNEHELLGLPKDALIFFYTSAGEKFTQRIAYSIDGGNTLIKLPNPCLETNYKEDRDPKVFWHEQSHAYIMVLWLEKTDFGIFRSTDLINWEQTDKVILQDGWECPDLVEIEFEDGSKRWAFLCADGYYYWGTFDGYHFVTDGRKHLSYFNKNLYAAQTYSGLDDKKIFVPWLRLENDGDNYTGAMGIPREMKGIHTEEEDYICYQPIPFLIDNDYINQIVWKRPEDVSVKNNIVIEETNITYNWETGEIQVGDQFYLTCKDAKTVSLIIDTNILEIFIDSGRLSGAFLLEK